MRKLKKQLNRETANRINHIILATVITLHRFDFYLKMIFQWYFNMIRIIRKFCTHVDIYLKILSLPNYLWKVKFRWIYSLIVFMISSFSIEIQNQHLLLYKLQKSYPNKILTLIIHCKCYLTTQTLRQNNQHNYQPNYWVNVAH